MDTETQKQMKKKINESKIKLNGKRKKIKLSGTPICENN